MDIKEEKSQRNARLEQHGQNTRKERKYIKGGLLL